MEFVCKKCNKTYCTESGLWKHNKAYHSNNKHVVNKEDKTYACAYCDKKFDYYQSRWRHEQKCKIKNQKSLVIKVKELVAEITALKAEKNM